MSIEEEKDITCLPEIQKKKQYDISDLTIQQQRFVGLYLTGQFDLSKIAQLLDVHRNTLTLWLKREDVKSVIVDTQELTHEIVASQLKTLTIAATNKLMSLINSPIDGVALNAVKDVLDRAGHKPRQEIKIDKTVTFEEKLRDIMDKTLDAEYEVREVE